MTGFSGMVSFEVKGGKQEASRLVEVRQGSMGNELLSVLPCYYVPIDLKNWTVLAPQPIRCKTKTNRDLTRRVFPRIWLDFSLVEGVVLV